MTRVIISHPTTYYVDRLSGSDVAGDGSQEHPWRSIQYGVDWLKKEIDFALCEVTLQLVGTGYNEHVTVATHNLGHHVFTIRGNPNNPDGCLWAASSQLPEALISITDYGAVTVDGIEFGSYVDGALLIDAWQFAIVDLQNIVYGSCENGRMIVAGDGGKINFTGPQVLAGNASVFAQADGGVIDMSSVPISMRIPLSFGQFAWAANGGKIKRSTGFSGCPATGKQYTLGPGGILQTSGVTLPGSQPGTNDRGFVC